jgi:hypothetical protein
MTCHYFLRLLEWRCRGGAPGFGRQTLPAEIYEQMRMQMLPETA